MIVYLCLCISGELSARHTDLHVCMCHTASVLPQIQNLMWKLCGETNVLKLSSLRQGWRAQKYFLYCTSKTKIPCGESNSMRREQTHPSLRECNTISLTYHNMRVRKEVSQGPFQGLKNQNKRTFEFLCLYKPKYCQYLGFYQGCYWLNVNVVNLEVTMLPFSV